VGEQGNLHEVMIALEKAKLSFELILAVRNKSLEAYQELMRMQI
jgi:flagellar hook-basal body complex protein FliE